MHPEIEAFIKVLSDNNLIYGLDEAIIIAKLANVNNRPDYEFLVKVVATRAAHKKFGPGNLWG